MNNPLAGTDPTGYMGCAASKIDTVCARTDANHGGFAEPGAIPSGISSGGAGKGNGVSPSQPAQVTQQLNTTELQSQTKNSDSVEAKWVGEGIVQTGEDTYAGTAHCDADCYSRANRDSMQYGSATLMLTLVAIDGPAPVGDVLAGLVGISIIIHNMSSDRPDPLMSMRDAAGIGSPMPDPNDPDRGSNDPKLNNKEADKILRKKGYKPQKQLSSQSNTVYYNPKGQPKYLVRSNTSHRGDAFKGYNSPRDIKLDNRAGSYDVNLNRVGK
ncbi:toxin C-terminal domain-containing protein [Rheinheimera muenzenbergensis]|uniref:Toxin C-terminal domain-containing protein n=2 Tax=Rheinheimera muenzenbergensis TaxID=1193628 RepID=A0ABU8CC40_9GAMM